MLFLYTRYITLINRLVVYILCIVQEKKKRKLQLSFQPDFSCRMDCFVPYIVMFSVIFCRENGLYSITDNEYSLFKNHFIIGAYLIRISGSLFSFV